MPSEARSRRLVRILAALAMVAIGVLHLVAPDGFVRIVPDALPAKLFLVYLSGIFEILGGVGLLLRPVHRLAAYGLIALYVAVFPANINMAVNDIQPVGSHLPAWALWGRLPFQVLFIGIAWWLSRAPTRRAP